MKSSLFFILMFIILQSTIVVAKTVEFKQNNPLIDIKKANDEFYEITYNNLDNIKPVVVKSKNLNLIMINNSFIPNAIFMDEANDRFIPLRLVFEALGTGVTWNESDRSIDVENKFLNWKGKLNIDKPTVNIISNNNFDFTVQSKPKIINGVTYVSYETLRCFFTFTTSYIDTNNDLEFDNKKIEILTMISENYNHIKNKPNEITDGFEMFLKRFPNKESSLKTARFSSDLNQYYLYKLQDKDYYAFFINKWTDELFVVKKTDNLF